MSGELPEAALERVAALWKRVISAPKGFDTFVAYPALTVRSACGAHVVCSALFQSEFMREWEVLFEALDESKRKQFVYALVRFVLQRHDAASLRQHAAKRGAMYALYGLTLRDYAALAAALAAACAAVLDETSPENARAWAELVLHYARVLVDTGATLAEAGMRAEARVWTRRGEWRRYHVRVGLDTLELFHTTRRTLKARYPLDAARLALCAAPDAPHAPPNTLRIESDTPPFALQLAFDTGADEWLAALQWRVAALQRVAGAQDVAEAARHRTAVDAAEVEQARRVWRVVLSPGKGAASALAPFAQRFFAVLSDASPTAHRLFADCTPPRLQELLVHAVTFLLNAYLASDAPDLDERGTLLLSVCSPR